jgi:hypothetical protein
VRALFTLHRLRLASDLSQAPAAHWRKRLASGAALVLLGACASPVPQTPHAAQPPPAPATVTRVEPGGNADNPQVAALQRLLAEPWGIQSDKANALDIALPDAPHWRRVRFWLVPTYTGFRYGDKHHGAAAFLIREAPKDVPLTSDACLHDFESWARPIADGMRVTITDPEIARIPWQTGRVSVRARDTSVPFGFETKRYATVYGAYALWGTSCGILAYAFPMNEDAELARHVRDRFVHDAFSQFRAKSTTRPE